MAYSLEKIAKEFGISKSAVSFIINGKAAENRISPELEEKVKEFCESVNYRPNIHARRMSSRIVGNVGLLINESMLADRENPFSDQIISEITGGAVLAAAKKGFRVTIQLYDSSMDEEKVFEWLRNREVDGLIYYGDSFDWDWMKSFLEEKRCVVGIGIEPMDGVSTVNINNSEMMYELTRRLVRRGRKQYCYVTGTDSYVGYTRLLGMYDAMKEGRAEAGEEFGLANHFCADFSEDKAYAEFMKIPLNFDAVICENDDMAVGALRALRERGVRIPEDVSIIGADNIKATAYTDPPITTFDNMSTELGKTAFNELYRLINGEKPRATELKSRIIERNSI